MQRTARAGYDSDFTLWAEEQAAALREGRFADLDMPHLLAFSLTRHSLPR
jgi:hypothetical protein